MSEYFVYVLENQKGRLYIGQTDNLERRLSQHNSPEGKNHLGKYTHKNGPWHLLGFEEFPSRSMAMIREGELKSWKSPTKLRAVFGTSAVESRQGRD
ncbi:GIY-YIG nuclease family protein [Puniceicoccales bacterium CK1056]|uniref:GIY-YIG nuclease family protein n=2 Tax=Oceanipulchritudo coccoides TaxID=2706888 RepID=A0A6B2M723_9BACT|nr:GIY-YIG nuclease family protein [Oceanipulchritudo coccoides]